MLSIVLRIALLGDYFAYGVERGLDVVATDHLGLHYHWEHCGLGRTESHPELRPR